LSAAAFSRALVLTAGLGTRLRPLTGARAKAAVPVDGEPLARRVLRWLVDNQVTDLVLNLHHRAASITRVIGDGSDCGARVRYSWEWPLLGSAGGPRHALPLLLDGTSRRTILLVNGDTLTDVDLSGLADQHRRSGAAVTMALIANEWPEKYGGVLLDGDGAVTGFTRRGDRRPSFHFIGVQAAEADVFAGLDDGTPAESVLGVYPRLMASRPDAVRGFVSTARFQDIGTPRDLLTTSLALAAAQGRPGRPLWGRNVSVAVTATVERSALWDNVTIGADARLDECVVADGVTIPAGARFAKSAIVRGDQGVDAGQRVVGDLVVADL
jgi:mannose-1-phosphate guanylyltransferase